MTLVTCIKNLVLSAGRSKSAIFVVISLLAPLTWSCGGQKAIRQETRCNERDSVMERVTTTTRPVTVPLSRVSLRLKEIQLSELEPGMMFRGKSGQASVQVEKKDSTIYITATCDSLQLLVEQQKTEIYRLRERFEEQKTTVEKRNFWKELKNGAIYILTGMGIMLLIKR